MYVSYQVRPNKGQQAQKVRKRRRVDDRKTPLPKNFRGMHSSHLRAIIHNSTATQMFIPQLQ